MTAQTQPSPLLNWLYETDRGPLRRQPFKIDFGGRPLPTTLLNPGTQQSLALSAPGKDSGYFVSSQQFAIRQSEKCSDCQTTAAGTDLYFGFFQHRGVTRLRRADTQAIKYTFKNI